MKFMITKANSNAAVITKTPGKVFAHFLKNFITLTLNQMQLFSILIKVSSLKNIYS